MEDEGCEPVVGSLAPAKKKEYRITNRLQEGQRPIYAVAFNFLDSRYLNVFVTVGGNRSYVDEDACSDEESPFIVAGGSKGIIRVIDAGRESIYRYFSYSNELDESLRLWNTQTGICILIFAGAGGHRNEILSVDFHPSDIYRICSCGMDTTVKIWSIKDFWTYVEKSFTWTDHPSKFPTKFVQHPVYTASVHVNYVDCTRWLGDFILSKTTLPGGI
ncbi:hypothetical protein V8G54_026294 [Vigna mungo]|uniref:Polycomb group protein FERTILIZATION-INDEPENDENT ENDOSPERM n=1 Tax=Vigna mungo TaxID=3915 RepID=A0AAQ3MYH1_VIGMU